MSENGFIKLYRKIQKSSMYRSLNSKQRDVMMQCLLLANHTGKEWEWGGEIYKCAPGQFITSLESLRDVCAKDVKIQSIRTALLKLEKWQFLTNKSTKHGRLITIVNWALYQSSTNQPTNKSTDSQQSTNKELTTNKNVENVKNVENNNPPVVPPLKSYLKTKITEHGFDQHQNKIIEFYEYRMGMPKKDRYRTQKGVDGLIRDLKGCLQRGMDITTCIDIAMERDWKTPNPEYFNAQTLSVKSKGANNRSQQNAKACADFISEMQEGK